MEQKAEAIKNAGKAVDNTPLWKEDANTLEEIGDNIQILNDQLQTATIDEAALINRQIEAWNEKADAIRNAGKEAEKQLLVRARLWKKAGAALRVSAAA